MFKVVSNRTFTHEVTVMMPSDGGYTTEKFKATFNYLGSEEANAFDVSTDDGALNFMKRIIARLDDITDDAGMPIPYSDALRDQVLNMPNPRRALLKSYFSAMAKAAEGN